MLWVVAKLDYDYAGEKLGSRPENVNFGIKVSVVKSLLDSKSVNFEEGQSQAITNAQLGKLANNGTVFLSCWMTEAQYEKMREKKAMFKNVFSK